MNKPVSILILALLCGCSSPKPESSVPPLPSNIYPTNVLVTGSVIESSLPAPPNPAVPYFQSDGQGGWSITYPPMMTNWYFEIETSPDLKTWSLQPPEYYGLPGTNMATFSRTSADQFFRMVCCTNTITNV
jgi:hypothetical protein